MLFYVVAVVQEEVLEWDDIFEVEITHSFHRKATATIVSAIPKHSQQNKSQRTDLQKTGSYCASFVQTLVCGF